MKNSNYFDNPNTDEVREARTKKKKKGGAAKVILMLLGMIVIALAAFVITIKVISPDFDLTALVPKKVISIITINPETTESTTVTTTESTTVTTTAAPVGYLPIEDFQTKDSKKGNQMGNILNGGLVATDMTYIYHIVNGEGIYRFNPSSESYLRVYKTADKLCSLNLRGEYLYFVNKSDGKLYALKKGSQKTEALAEKVKHAYIYDNSAYYVTKDNRLCVMNLEKRKEKTLYQSADEAMTLTGVSLKRVFFTVEGISSLKFMTVDIKGKTRAQEFREAAQLGGMMSPVLENGFLYYYARQADGSYQLCRNKYGSEQIVTLAEAVSKPALYPVVDSNKVFYATAEKEGRFSMTELNMNSNKTKIMLSVGGVGEDNTLSFYHGGVYDFIIGKKSADGKRVYDGSSMYTGSTNVMSFKNGSWSY